MTAPAAVHLALPCPYGGGCAGPVPCSGIDLCRPGTWKRTADRAQVTCGNCRNSPAYREAA